MSNSNTSAKQRTEMKRTRNSITEKNKQHNNKHSGEVNIKRQNSEQTYTQSQAKNRNEQNEESVAIRNVSEEQT